MAKFLRLSAALIAVASFGSRHSVISAAVEGSLAFGLLALRHHEGGEGDGRLIALIGQWWTSGYEGCLFEESSTSSPNNKLPGLELCLIPKEFTDTLWFRKTPSSGFALMPLLLLRKFPTRRFFALGDASTVFSPMALGPWLASNFDPHEPWYIGGRAEHIALREREGWDVPFAAAGIVISAAAVEGTRGDDLARCVDGAADWDRAPGGAWVLNSCFSRLGLPVTPVGGFHQLDGTDRASVRHVLEEHVSGPFLGLAQRPWHSVKGNLGITPDAFFLGLSRNPASFLSLTVAEVRTEKLGTWMAAISSGLSIRLWRSQQHGLLWWGQAKTESLSAERKFRAASLQEEAKTEERYTFSPTQPPQDAPGGKSTAGILLSLYLPGSGPRRRRRLDAQPWQQWKHAHHDAAQSQQKTPQDPGAPLASHPKASQPHKAYPSNYQWKPAAIPNYPWAAIVVVEDRRSEPSSRHRLAGAPRSLCLVTTHEASSGSQDQPGRRVLILRVRDCRLRGSPLLGGGPGANEILGESYSLESLFGLLSGIEGNNQTASGSEQPGPISNASSSVTAIELPSMPFAFLPIHQPGGRTKPTRIKKDRRTLLQASLMPKNSSISAIEFLAQNATEDLPRRSLESNANCEWVAWKKALVCPTSAQLAAAQLKDATKDIKTKSFPPGQLFANQAGSPWQRHLSAEHGLIKNGIAFGILTSGKTAADRLAFLRFWWLPGAVGCLSVDPKLDVKTARSLLGALVPPGLEVCEGVPSRLKNKPWMETGQKGRGLHRGALMHLVLFSKFPTRQWFVVGDDDTLFNPLALAQWLGNFDSKQSWYIGGRSENVPQRDWIGWDMAFGGGGLVLSGGFLQDLAGGAAFDACFDQAPWAGSPGGDKVLYYCLTRMGVPLTAGGGFHQIDLWQESPEGMRDIFDHHPVAPFLSIHHSDRYFVNGGSVSDQF